MFHLFLLSCYYYSVMYVTVMPVSAYMALAFVFGFIQINWWCWWINEHDDDDELTFSKKNNDSLINFD